MQMFISIENTKAANSMFTLWGMRSKDASSQGGFLFKKVEGGKGRKKGGEREQGRWRLRCTMQISDLFMYSGVAAWLAQNPYDLRNEMNSSY